MGRECKFEDEDANDLFHLVCGPQLGYGQYRYVYEHALDKKLVVKHETGNCYSNMFEYQIWSEYGQTPLGKWLAPVHWISGRNAWLIMSRTTPIEIGNYPKRIPKLFADVKPENWGMFDGRPVCHDYGNHQLFTLARDLGRVLKSVVWEHEV